MKSIKVFAGLVVLFSLMISNSYAGVLYETANVINVQPNFENVPTEKRVCEEVVVRNNQPRSIAGAIFGSTIGGIAAQSVGKGNGHNAAVALLPGAGAFIGDRIENNSQQYSQVQQQCRYETNYVQRQNGFLVTYEYKGTQQTEVMNYNPGQTVQIQVSVRVRGY